MTLLQSHEKYSVHHGDCIPHMRAMPKGSVDFAVFSPPFPALYAYTDKNEDIGNSEGLETTTPLHMAYFYAALAPVIKPGRAVIVHVCQIPRMKRTGGVGLFDFRGLNIRLGERHGLIYEYDWLIRKNPQSQAIRTRSRELQFAGLESDRTKTRGSLCDYLIKFRAPGDNAVVVDTPNEVSREDWIRWAEGAWFDINETDTLNVKEGRGENDTRHICPLQLGVIGRVIRLFTNPDEIVFSPFAGIGSEGYEAIRLGRRFYGCELKDEYFSACLANLGRAESDAKHEAGSMLFGVA